MKFVVRKQDVEIGGTYVAQVSGRKVEVRIISVSMFGGWNATNLMTKRKIRIKTAARLTYSLTPFDI